LFGAEQTFSEIFGLFSSPYFIIPMVIRQ